MSYYLKGEAGKAMDATFRAIGSDLVITDAVMIYENLGIDMLTWEARTIDLDAGETILPEVGQMVELYQGTLPTPTRYFRGWVTEARNVNYGTVVKVEGPAQWLRKMTIDTVQGSETRPAISFTQQAIATSITALVNRAIAMGAPIALGTIATTYTIPTLQLSLQTFGDVLAELVRWLPDAVVWWDYSGTGTPALNVWRRTGLSTTSYAAGSGGEVKNHQVTGRPDLVPSQVSIKYRTRATSGTRQYASQNDGSVVVGRVQSIGLSGEELTDFVPPDDIESFQFQSIDANQTVNNLKPWILKMLPEVIASRLSYAGQPTDTRVTLSNADAVQVTYPGGSIAYYNQPRLSFINIATGLEESRVGKYLLVSSDPPEWVAENLAGAVKVKVSGRIYRLEENFVYKSPGSTQAGDWQAGPLVPTWAQAFAWNQVFDLQGYFPSSSIPFFPWASGYLTGLDFEVDTYLISGSYPALTTLWKAQAFQFRSPPAGLAANLRSAQNFTPYEGAIELQRASAPVPANLLTERVNITGAQTELATMAAMPKRVTHRLTGSSYLTTIELGAPVRFSFGTLSSRIRGTSQGNINL